MFRHFENFKILKKQGLYNDRRGFPSRDEAERSKGPVITGGGLGGAGY
jgi:hypothetical protein